jgi:hypothetical protein
VALDPTVGGASANSYASLAEADAFMGDRLNADAWTEAGEVSPPIQEAALITAARRLDQEPWAWSKASTDQALEFPRAGQTDKNGTSVDTDGVPTWLKNAQIELALAMLGEDLLENTGLEGMKRVKVDVLEFEPVAGARAGALPANVRRYFPEGAVQGSAVTFGILRGG